MMITPRPHPPLTREQVRAVDRLAIERLGIPGLILMENAGRSAAHALLDLLATDGEPHPRQWRVAILCGGGNNGGDGYVIARHLHNHDVNVEIFTLKAPAALHPGVVDDAATNHAICHRMGLPIEFVRDVRAVDAAAARWAEADAVVDALLGTGFQGEVRDPIATAIDRLNTLGESGKHGPRVMAVDVPSGLDCQTGEPGTHTVRANLTVTFVAEKVGFSAPAAKPYLGRVVVADIGVPPELVRQAAAS